ncbi:MAG: hypothetical protein WC775_05545 [Patescibacteria group bacterium]|jgi:hypothetical protein
MTDADAIQQTKVLLGYELFLHTVTLMTHFAFEKNKPEVIDAIKALVLAFQKSLTEEEKTDYQERLDNLLKEKGDALVAKLGENLTPEEIKDLLPKFIDQDNP